MPRVTAPFSDHRRRPMMLLGLLALACALAVFAAMTLIGDDDGVAKHGDVTQVLGGTETRPVLIPADVTAAPTTNAAPINTLPPRATVAPTIVEETTTITLSLSPDERWAAALATTTADYPELADRNQDQLRVFVDSICEALTNGASQDFVTADIERQADEKNWSAELAAGVDALRVAGTEALCPEAA